MIKKKNVVIIMADQLRADVLGGQYTPNINKLAEEGVEFRRSYCASPLCVPARGSFFTGKYPNETGSIINPWEKTDKKHGNVREGIPNLYSLMEQDWDSWHIGKQHFFTEEKIDASPTSKTHWVYTDKDYNNFLQTRKVKKPGGEAFKGMLPEMVSGKVTHISKYSIPTIGCYEEGVENYFDGYFTVGAVEAIRGRDKEKPFLLNAMFLAPHPPFEIPEPWYSKYDKVELPENVGKWGKDQSPLQLYNLTGIIGSRYNRGDWEKVWPVYMGLVSLLDDCVGQIIDELKAQGIYDDTLIIFTSDHGEMLGSHCLWQKMCMYEESVRIPLYMKFPKDYHPVVKVSDTLVSAVDVFPTICDYLGLELPENVSGLSLMPVIEGGELDRERIFIQYDGNGSRGNFQRCVVEDYYKLIVDIFKDEIYIELYNTQSDSQEMFNLAFEKEYEGLVRKLLKHLNIHMNKTGDLITLPSDIYEDFIKDYTPFREDRG
jgi:arylsulfatase A-like enzyme